MPGNDAVAIVHTRPQSLADDVAALGFEPLLCPTLQAVTLDHDVPDAGLYIVSSVHAVSSVPEGKTVIAVGAKTREAAFARGLNVAHECATMRGLLDLDIPSGQRIVHLCGKHVSPDTVPALNVLDASRVCVYEARPLDHLPQSVIDALRDGRLAAILVFSARGAEAFTALAKRATNSDAWKRVTCAALSPRVARAMSGLPLATLRVAAQPNRKEILRALRSS